MATKGAVSSQPQGGTTAYEYANEPSAVPHDRKRARYRDPAVEEGARPANIMWDPRVYRGSNFGTEVLTPSEQAHMERLEKEEADRTKRRKASRRRRAVEAGRSRTPPPVAGREHASAQTDEYLEEITDRPVEEEVGVQTEAFADRPPSPLFVPHKTGEDVGTEIAPGDLFDFDFEVEPVLEVLIGKTLEMSLMEVLEEEELAAIRRHQEEFEQLRAAELAEVQRLEEEARRKAEEKRRRMNQEKERLRREAKAREKVAAAAFARHYLQEIRSSVFSALEREGHFFDPVAREVETKFLPDVLSAAKEHIDQKILAATLADDLIRAAIQAQRSQRDAEVERIRKIREEEERQREIERQRIEDERKAKEEALRKQKEEEERKAKEEEEGGEDEEEEED